MMINRPFGKARGLDNILKRSSIIAFFDKQPFRRVQNFLHRLLWIFIPRQTFPLP